MKKTLINIKKKFQGWNSRKAPHEQWKKESKRIHFFSSVKFSPKCFNLFLSIKINFILLNRAII
jgi:hypothetical protein